jgi:hypothetical protein
LKTVFVRPLSQALKELQLHSSKAENDHIVRALAQDNIQLEEALKDSRTREARLRLFKSAYMIINHKTLNLKRIGFEWIKGRAAEIKLKDEFNE